MINRYKFTILYIILVILSPFVLMVVTSGIHVPLDNFILIFLSIVYFLLLRKKIELTNLKRIVFIILMALISFLAPIIILMVIMPSPGQKDAGRILFDVCIPEIENYYKEKGQKNYLEGPLDKEGNSKYNYQVWECEQNMRDGKGLAFSENPANFIPASK